jgi:hypothetical protein
MSANCSTPPGRRTRATSAKTARLCSQGQLALVRVLGVVLTVVDVVVYRRNLLLPLAVPGRPY